MIQIKVIADGVRNARGEAVRKGVVFWCGDELAKRLLDEGKAVRARPWAPPHQKVVRPSHSKR